MIRKVLPFAVLLVVVVAAAVVLLGARRSEDHYRVRAIFDNAGFVIPGEDVKVAGVKVGKITSVDVTPDFKAAVVLQIDEPGYQDFRRDASCIVRPQNLIGERFVECKPTQQRAVGGNPPPELAKIDRGPGKGQYLLPVSNTLKTVDIDLIGNTMREPERERFSLILNELGTGVAGRGRDLNDVIRRADPALKETDDVLRILASQNKTLEQLAVNSDTVLAPLARERAHVAGAIRNSSEVAKATAERRGALATDIEKLPRFLDELEPTMTDLGALADQSTPVFTDLRAQAPAINQVIQRMGPFSTAAIPAVDSLGEASKRGIPAVKAARPVIADTRKLAKAVRPVGKTARQVLESFRDSHGIERLMDYIFYQVAAINGYDAVGHYLRAALIVNQCATYAIAPVAGCSANFPQSASSSSAQATAVAATANDDPVLMRTARALARALGMKVPKAQKAKAKDDKKKKHPKDAAKKAKQKADDKAAAAPAETATPGADGGPPTPATPSVPVPAPTTAPAPAESPTATATPDPSDALLDYLFGHGGGGG
jgi:phospholipid/cholesterol/gamma-HCH transport system substrate-binding protein